MIQKIIFFFFCPFATWGQPFALDTTFQPEHEFPSSITKQYLGNVYALLEETNGSVMAVGSFLFNDINNIRINIARFYPNGSIDPGWYPNTWNDVTLPINSIQKVGGVYYFNTESVGIHRSTSSGNFFDNAFLPLDTNFATGTHIPYVFPDGSIMVGAMGGKYPSSNNFQRRLYFMRIKPNGWVDSSFHHNTNFDVQEVMPYDSTRLLLFGIYLTHYDSIQINKICRIDTAGNLDSTFHTQIFEWGSPRPRYIQPDGKIIVAGTFTMKNSSDTFCIARLHPDGTLDSSFNNFDAVDPYHPVWALNDVTTVCPTSDGGLLIGGQFLTYQGYPRNNIVKTDADGFIDLRYFDGEGIDSSKNHWNTPPRVTKIVPAQNDKYYVMGHFLKYNGQLVKPLIRILGLSHTVGVGEDIPQQIPLRVYPNPAEASATFEWELPPNQLAARLRVFTLMGQVVDDWEIDLRRRGWQSPPQGTNIVWETRQVSNGIYLYELRSEKGEILAQGKLAVQK